MQGREASRGTLRVLLIEASDSESDAVRRRLGSSDTVHYRSEVARSLAEAVEALADGAAFDAVLLDVDLPDARGRESLRAIRERAPEVPVVLLAGRDERELCNECLRDGAQDYLSKDDLGSLEQALRYSVARMRNDLEQRRIEEELRESQGLESLGLLAGGIAHDFNNILTGILGHATMCLDRLPEGSELAPGLQSIETAAVRAGELCVQLLAYSGHGRCVVGPIDVGLLVREVAEIFEVTLCQGHVLTCDVTPGLPRIEGTDARIRQVVMNLITNAVDALEGCARGRIVLRASTSAVAAETRPRHGGGWLEPGDYVVLEVQDDGCGMPESTLKQMFLPFFSTKKSGHGLGLSAVQGILHSHGGALYVESEAGVGTCVQVYLPAKEVPADAPLPDAVAFPETLDGGVAVVIEDDADIRKLVRGTLERAGMEVHDARDGDEGLALLEAHAEEASVVLLDLTLPGQGGEQVYRELSRRYAGVPVVLSSGYSRQETAARVGEVDLDAFLHKPYTVHQLRSACALALGRRGKRPQAESA